MIASLFVILITWIEFATFRNWISRKFYCHRL